MTREEAIKIIDCYDIGFYDLSGEKIPADKLADALDMAIEALSADAVQGWIPCYERLPKTGDSVLATYSDGEVGIVWSARPKAWVRYIESNNLIYPIAWMPLPTPYKESEVKE